MLARREPAIRRPRKYGLKLPTRLELFSAIQGRKRFDPGFVHQFALGRMKSIVTYLRALMSDLLYWRVSVAIFGASVAVPASIVLVRSRTTDALGWFALLLPAAFVLYGAYLVYAASLGSDATFETLVAIPVTIALRLLRPNRPKA
jgi:hypothetical protein